MKTALLALAACVAASTPARAGEAACWYENGVVVVTAEVAGVVGDFILDTGQARTQLAETQVEILRTFDVGDNRTIALAHARACGGKQRHGLFLPTVPLVLPEAGHVQGYKRWYGG